MSENINYGYITEYIRNAIVPNDEFLQELENYADKNNIPIIQPEVVKFIHVVGKIKAPQKILEIGTAIGYSSILMSKVLQCNGKIVTIEKDNEMIYEATKNIQKAGLSDTIKVLEGDAKKILPQLSEKFDLIFMDASKGHYLEFLDYCLDLLNTSGILISDNIFYKGMIANNDLVIRRKKTIVKRMRQYLEYICNHNQLDTSLIPIGDGVALSYKRS